MPKSYLKDAPLPPNKERQTNKKCPCPSALSCVQSGTSVLPVILPPSINVQTPLCSDCKGLVASIITGYWYIIYQAGSVYQCVVTDKRIAYYQANDILVLSITIF